MKVLYLILFYLTFLTTFVSSAQKLPDKQQVGMRASANVKIDGVAAELKEKFLAYNAATNLYYTIANDDKNLYLTIRATNGDIINRITGGGITFTIKNKDHKEDAGVSVTYPIRNTPAIVVFSFWPRKDQPLDTTRRTADSTMKANNKRLISTFKFLKVKGIKDLDTLSIYNQNGIEAAGAFNMKKAYTIELSIPLQLLSNEINSANAFTYQIRVNGGAPNSFNIRLESVEPAVKAQIEEAIATATFKVESAITAPTDFLGEYTLVN